MMSASPNDVCLRAHKGKHRIIATIGSDIIMRSITSYRPMAIHHLSTQSGAFSISLRLYEKTQKEHVRLRRSASFFRLNSQMFISVHSSRLFLIGVIHFDKTIFDPCVSLQIRSYAYKKRADDYLQTVEIFIRATCRADAGHILY